MLWFNTHEEEQTLKWLKNIKIDNLSDSDRKIFVTALQKFLDKLNPIRERYEQNQQKVQQKVRNDALEEALKEYNEHYGKTTFQDYNQATKTIQGQRGNET